MRWRPSPAMAVALIALFVSATGVGYAVSKLPKNSVKSKQIKDGQVKSVDVADNGLTGSDIDESSLNVQGTPGPRGATGPQGSQGPQGATGPQGPTDFSVVQARVSSACPGQSSIQSIGQNGTVTCGTATSGQGATTVFGTTALVAPGPGFTPIPGLTQSVSVPSDATTYIATDGGYAATAGTVVVDVAIYVDGVADGPVQRGACAAGLNCIWSLSHASALSAGAHTITVRAIQSGGAGTASISGSAGSGAQGELTVMFLKQ